MIWNNVLMLSRVIGFNMDGLIFIIGKGHSILHQILRNNGLLMHVLLYV